MSVFSKVGLYLLFGHGICQSQCLSLLVDPTIKFLPETIDTDFCSHHFGSCAFSMPMFAGRLSSKNKNKKKIESCSAYFVVMSLLFFVVAIPIAFDCRFVILYYNE